MADIKYCDMNIFKFLPALFVILIMVSQGLLAQRAAEPWPVPESYKKMKNPYPGDEEALDIGEMLYAQHCMLCHGKNGFGNGPGGRGLSTEVTDLTSEAVQSQSEGELFYKITTGRKEMPEYKNKIPSDKDRWNLVSYILKYF